MGDSGSGQIAALDWLAARTIGAEGDSIPSINCGSDRDQSQLSITVIVPTRNEVGNIAVLLARLDVALQHATAEVLFVDDSDDETPELVRTLARSATFPVRLLHRDPEARAGGLGSAVLAGLREARGAWAVVMDGDLQHPPERVPELVAAGIRDDADLVVATRYAPGGARAGLSSIARHCVSAGSTVLAKATFPRRLHHCSDPMSGFFAARLASIDLTSLQPSGFKVLLEVIARHPKLRIAEVPFTFGERLTGQSKASLREGLLFARRLAALRWATWLTRTPWLTRLAVFAGFGAVGVTGIVVNSAALWAFAHTPGIPLWLAATLATQVSTIWNFVLTDRWVFAGAKSRPVWQRLGGFAAVNNVVLLGRLPLLYWLTHLGMGYLWANVLTLLVAFAARFALSDRLLFTRKEMAMTDVQTPRTPTRDQPEGARRTGPVDLLIDLRSDAEPNIVRQAGTLAWQYNIHNLVRISSVVRLSELDSFETDPMAAADADTADALPDIEIRRGSVGTGKFRHRARVTQYAGIAAVTYQEHLGRFGSDFHIDMRRDRPADSDGPSGLERAVAPRNPAAIQVTVGPMLVRSPHVLYTNVVEALLRFVLVSRGHMLLHSACLELNGRGVMLSALTDTGKTGTILRLLRETPARFLSDDMTILCPDGTALDYPKPLTISQHTLRAVNAAELTHQEWRHLRVQSHIHSKQGRAVGSHMGEMNLPIMTMNAVTQYVVPPPKYDVERLVPCEHARSVPVSELFIIARGEQSASEITDREALVDELIANTDDAYGFPPFRYFAPALVADGMGYEELRASERRILASAIGHVTAHRLVTPDFSWADRIPQMLAAPRQSSPSTPADQFALHPSPAARAEANHDVATK